MLNGFHLGPFLGNIFFCYGSDADKNRYRGYSYVQRWKVHTGTFAFEDVDRNSSYIGAPYFIILFSL